MARSYSQTTIQLLFGKSRMHCAFPNCKAKLLAEAQSNDQERNLAEIAHIVAHSDDGPRADPSMSEKDRNAYPNLILLCGHHHKLVDAQPNTYSIEDLRQWKQDLEAWVEDKLTEGLANVHFSELQFVCDALVNNASLASSPLTAVPPAQKMQANGLTNRLNYRMHLGLAQAPQVAEFIERIAGIDGSYPQRLRSGFVEKYEEFEAVGLGGDALFLALTDFAGSAAARPDQTRESRWETEAAALAVLCHLFEICDVFEAPAA